MDSTNETNMEFSETDHTMGLQGSEKEAQSLTDSLRVAELSQSSGPKLGDDRIVQMSLNDGGTDINLNAFIAVTPSGKAALPSLVENKPLNLTSFSRLKAKENTNSPGQSRRPRHASLTKLQGSHMSLTDRVRSPRPMPLSPSTMRPSSPFVFSGTRSSKARSDSLEIANCYADTAAEPHIVIDDAYEETNDSNHDALGTDFRHIRSPKPAFKYRNNLNAANNKYTERDADISNQMASHHVLRQCSDDLPVDEDRTLVADASFPNSHAQSYDFDVPLNDPSLFDKVSPDDSRMENAQLNFQRHEQGHGNRSLKRSNKHIGKPYGEDDQEVEETKRSRLDIHGQVY